MKLYSPDVRDRAIFEAREVLFSWIEGRSIDPELAPAIVDAMVSVVAPEIERPLQARITELEAALAFMLKRFDPGGDMATLRTVLAGAEKPDDQLAALEAEFPKKAPMLRQAMKDAPAAILRLQARVDELEAALTDDDKLLRFGVDRGLISDHAHKLILQRNALQARVELLTAALTGISGRCEYEGDRYQICEQRFDEDQADWCYPCIARAALAAGETESEGP